MQKTSKVRVFKKQGFFLYVFCIFFSLKQNFEKRKYSTDIIFSRVHATLHPSLSVHSSVRRLVSQSVGRSLGRSVGLSHFYFFYQFYFFMSF